MAEASLVAQNLICLQCRRLRFDRWVGKIPLEKKMAPHSSDTWRIQWTEEPSSYSPWACKESNMTKRLTQTMHVKNSTRASTYEWKL